MVAHSRLKSDPTKTLLHTNYLLKALHPYSEVLFYLI